MQAGWELPGAPWGGSCLPLPGSFLSCCCVALATAYTAWPTPASAFAAGLGGCWAGGSQNFNFLICEMGIIWGPTQGLV